MVAARLTALAICLFYINFFVEASNLLGPPVGADRRISCYIYLTSTKISLVSPASSTSFVCSFLRAST